VVLVDAGPLVAICDARDSKHRTAVRQLESLAPDGLLVCDAVLTETCFHLPHRNQRLRLGALLCDLPIEPFPESQNRAVRDQVFEWLIKYADHEPDWGDAWLAVLSGQFKRMKVWTYDREFRSMWRRPDGTAIPLAIK
jgi:predicted nucleic acid-binding protein